MASGGNWFSRVMDPHMHAHAQLSYMYMQLHIPSATGTIINFGLKAGMRDT